MDRSARAEPAGPFGRVPALTSRQARDTLKVKKVAGQMKSVQFAMVVVLVLGSACTEGTNLAGDGGAQDPGNIRESSDEMLETSTDGGTDGGDAGDPEASDGELPTCAGGWFDPTSGLCWQDPPDETVRIWGDAVAYCDGLLLGGHDGWHLPTISELRSLVRGCPSIETGGTCGVTDSSTDFAGWGYDRCGGCIPLDGPGTGGCFWPAGLSGECGTYHSRTAVSGVSSVWGIHFYAGFVTYGPSGGWVRARCVRPGP